MNWWKCAPNKWINLDQIVSATYEENETRIPADQDPSHPPEMRPYLGRESIIVDRRLTLSFPASETLTLSDPAAIQEVVHSLGLEGPILGQSPPGLSEGPGPP
jgi:hypothetical protein